MTLDADEFMRRFLLHVLPKGLPPHSSLRLPGERLPRRQASAIRAALDAPEPAPTVEPADYRERYAMLTGHRIDLCPVCGGCMVEIGLWPRSRIAADAQHRAVTPHDELASNPALSHHPRICLPTLLVGTSRMLRKTSRRMLPSLDLLPLSTRSSSTTRSARSAHHQILLTISRCDANIDMIAPPRRSRTPIGRLNSTRLRSIRLQIGPAPSWRRCP